MSKVKISVVIPCYNEGITFEKSVSDITRVLKSLNNDWEIIFVEDKSIDQTKQTIEKIIKNTPGVRAIFHLKNEGRGKSVADGIKVSKGAICGFLDVDGEISPTYIPVFINEIEKRNDMVIATRFYESNNRFLRYLASKIYSVLVNKILDLPFKDTEAGFKFFKRSKILHVINKTNDNRWFFDTEICTRAYFGGLKISEVPVLFIRRVDKKSTVRLIPDSIEYFKKAMNFRSKVKRMKKAYENK